MKKNNLVTANDFGTVLKVTPAKAQNIIFVTNVRARAV
jgi:hypothetical protein